MYLSSVWVKLESAYGTDLQKLLEMIPILQRGLHRRPHSGQTSGMREGIHSGPPRATFSRKISKEQPLSRKLSERKLKRSRPEF